MPLERILFIVTGLLSRWYLFLMPLVIAAPLAFLVLKISPTKYEARSTILMISANRPQDMSTFARQNALEQVAVLEAWLKSDPTLRELLPQVMDEPVPTKPEAVAILINLFRQSLTLQLTGAGVLEIKLEGSKGQGLGRKLEIIVARLLEGVLNPEAGILSATQLILVRRREDASEAERALTRAIAEAELGAPEVVRSNLQALYFLKRERSADASTRLPSTDRGQAGGQATSTEVAAGLTQQLEAARAAISNDPKVVRGLEELYDAYEEARHIYQETRQRANSAGGSYVRVFDAPERLTVIGRPRDPLLGTSSGRKYAIGIMLLAMMCSVGLGVLFLLLDTRLRVAEDFEAAAGVPVVARLGRVRSALRA